MGGAGREDEVGMWLLFTSVVALADPPDLPPPPVDLTPPKPELRIGPIPGVTTPEPTGLRQCFDTPPLPAVTPDTEGQIVLQVRVRKGRLSIVSTLHADQSVQALAPCFEREIAAWSWGPRKGTFKVPVTVGPPPVPAPTPLPPEK
jgi:hypothetical protein